MTTSILESSKLNLITRRLCVEINGSMQQFSKSGHDAASWSPSNAKIGEILGVSDVFDNNPDIGTTATCLQNAVLHKITCLEVKNDFPINIGVTVSCVKKRPRKVSFFFPQKSFYKDSKRRRLF